MTDLATILTAAGVSLPTIGGGIGFLWNKIEKRFAKIEGELEKCRARETAANKRGAVHLTVIELLWLEVTRQSPGKPNSTLARAKKLMDDLKVSLPDEDDELTALAKQVDGVYA
jgi:hypothetical protein